MHIGIFTNCDIDVGKHKAETLKRLYGEGNFGGNSERGNSHAGIFYAVTKV